MALALSRCHHGYNHCSSAHSLPSVDCSAWEAVVCWLQRSPGKKCSNAEGSEKLGAGIWAAGKELPAV